MLSDSLHIPRKDPLSPSCQSQYRNLPAPLLKTAFGGVRLKDRFQKLKGGGMGTCLHQKQKKKGGNLANDILTEA